MSPWFLDKGKSEANKDKILMIDARNTFRKVNTTISDFSAGQLQNFSAIMQTYRGDKHAIKQASLANQKDSIQQAGEILSQIEILKNQLLKSLADNAKEDKSNQTLDFSKATVELKQKAKAFKPVDTASHTDCEVLVSFFEKPFSALSDLIENYKTTLAIDKAAMLAAEKESKKKDSSLRKQLDAKKKTCAS